MPARTIADRDFDFSVVEARRAASAGPVVVTDCGEPAFALLSIPDFSRVSELLQRSASGSPGPSLLEVMDALPGGDFDFEPARVSVSGLHPADFE